MSTPQKQGLVQLTRAIEAEFSDFHIKGTVLPLIWWLNLIRELIVERDFKQISRVNPYSELRKRDILSRSVNRKIPLISPLFCGGKSQFRIGFELHIKGNLLPLIYPVELVQSLADFAEGDC